jgi:hypothetical protein
MKADVIIEAKVKYVRKAVHAVTGEQAREAAVADFKAFCAKSFGADSEVYVERAVYDAIPEVVAEEPAAEQSSDQSQPV